jgi:hypothetical protein
MKDPKDKKEGEELSGSEEQAGNTSTEGQDGAGQESGEEKAEEGAPESDAD